MQASERPSPHGSSELLVGLAFALLGWLVKFLLIDVWHFTGKQTAEFLGYFLLLVSGLVWLCFRSLGARSRREQQWPHPYMAVPRRKDEQAVSAAWAENAVVLGYDVHGKPCAGPTARG